VAQNAASSERSFQAFKGKTKNYKALVADVNLKGRLSGWDMRDRSGKSTRRSRSFTCPGLCSAFIIAMRGSIGSPPCFAIRISSSVGVCHSGACCSAWAT
jgi:hypothetical protein